MGERKRTKEWRNKSWRLGQLISIEFKDNSTGKKIAFCWTNSAGTICYPHAKEWNWIPSSLFVQKSTQNVETKSIKLLEHGCKSSWLSIRQSFVRHDTKSTSHKRKHLQTGLHQTWKLYVLQRTASTKCKDKTQNGSKHFQIIHVIKDLYLKYVRALKGKQNKTKIYK